ncbi:hypothetical protein QJS10_CPB04g01594 [Acorus calamus]|uniref:Uncharacterized protein n=1 Tax=Acorus calamus TaxID=4465 RepID=A0AAV9F2G4_ACOCL|nr:hypothetical protein QJS10_CPB04g01594 [Acorus calamus]
MAGHLPECSGIVDRIGFHYSDRMDSRQRESAMALEVMEHSNSISSPGPTTSIRCLCVLKQSKTTTNPARWFWSCPDIKKDEVNPIKSVSSIIRMLDCDLQQG